MTCIWTLHFQNYYLISPEQKVKSKRMFPFHSQWNCFDACVLRLSFSKSDRFNSVLSSFETRIMHLIFNLNDHMCTCHQMIFVTIKLTHWDLSLLCPQVFVFNFMLSLTHWPLRDVEVIVQGYFSKSFYELISLSLPVNWSQTTRKLLKFYRTVGPVKAHLLLVLLKFYRTKQTKWQQDAEIFFGR